MSLSVKFVALSREISSAVWQNGMFAAREYRVVLPLLVTKNIFSQLRKSRCLYAVIHRCVFGLVDMQINVRKKRTLFYKLFYRAEQAQIILI